MRMLNGQVQFLISSSETENTLPYTGDILSGDILSGGILPDILFSDILVAFCRVFVW